MDDVAPLAIEGLVLEMLAEVSRRKTEGVVKKTPRRLRQAEQLLHERFSESLRLSEISDAVGVHPVHLSRVFRKHYHCTIGDYMRRLRIEYASRQILTSKSTLLEIASNAGFSDQSHFSRIFRRHMGMLVTSRLEKSEKGKIFQDPIQMAEWSYMFTMRAHIRRIPIVAGTDVQETPKTQDFPNIHAELELLVAKAGLTPLEAITAATRNGAQILGISDSYGTIAPGKVADSWC